MLTMPTVRAGVVRLVSVKWFLDPKGGASFKTIPRHQDLMKKSPDAFLSPEEAARCYLSRKRKVAVLS